MNETRYCPICDLWMVDSICPTDGVSTISAEALSITRDTLSPGIVLADRYRIEELIGRGGMGYVYRANQTSIGRMVALKTLNSDFQTDQRMLKRFHREARAAATLEHPNIVKIYDFGIDDETGIPFIAMELLEGQPLNVLLSRAGVLTERRACQILAGVAMALVEAHEKGVIHRDLKPDNIYVRSLSDGTEHVKVLDFGIASIKQQDDTPAEKLTRTGVPLGTPHYMSPEQAMGRSVDYRSDLYSLGCILYELLVGNPPFSVEQPLAILMSQVQEPCPPLPGVLVDGLPRSDGLAKLYHALTEKDANQRPASTLAVAESFNALGGARISSVEQHLETLDSEWVFGSRVVEYRSSEGFATDPTVEAQALTEEASTSNIFAAAGEIRSPESALGLEAPPTQSNRAIWIVAALAMTTAILLWIMTQSNTDNKQRRSIVTPTPVTRTEVSPVAKNKADQTVVETAKPKDAVKQAPVSFSSSPIGSRVLWGERVLGTTPMEYRFKATDYPIHIRFEHRGFESKQSVILSGTTTVNTHLLRKAVQADPSSKRPKSMPKASKADPSADAGYKPAAW